MESSSGNSSPPSHKIWKVNRSPLDGGLGELGEWWVGRIWEWWNWAGGWIWGGGWRALLGTARRLATKSGTRIARRPSYAEYLAA